MAEGRATGAGLAGWSIRHPVGVNMIALALVVLGLVAAERLPVDLLPHIIYPEIRVRVLDPGVPARIMEDRVTRQLEEQLAITEGAVGVRSRSIEGVSSVDLSFPYGTDLDAALRDASARLDRAKRFLPDSIEPPIIYKLDPAQIPVAEFAVSSPTRSPAELRAWVDERFGKWFVNLPGVAAVEVGGGLVREIQVLPDPARLAAAGIGLDELADAVRNAGQDLPGGVVEGETRRYVTRLAGRFRSLDDLRRLPVRLGEGRTLQLGDLAEVRDAHAEEQLRVRFDGTPGVKVSIQKQPAANTVAVVEAVRARLAWLREQGLLPADVRVDPVADQAVYIRYALDNATLAAVSGALLAMAVVFLFLGDWRRTLIIGSAIPIAITITFGIMAWGGLTLNVMTLGGLAVGIGLLVDNAIVMLEHIERHQRQGEAPVTAGLNAAGEVASAVTAATSTNLAAILPFLLIGGLTGLLFGELIVTLAAGLAASLLVALTLVPAWAARLPAGRPPAGLRRAVAGFMGWLEGGYRRLLDWLLARRGRQILLAALFIGGLAATVPHFLEGRQIFLPPFDDGRIYIGITGDPGTPLEAMDRGVRRLEALLRAQPEVQDLFTVTGGFIFGRTERILSSRASLFVQLKPGPDGHYGSHAWVARIQPKVQALGLAGFKVRMRVRGLRGLRVGRGEDDITLRIQGPELATLHRLGETLAEQLRDVPGVRNLMFSGEETGQELVVHIDRARAARFGLSTEDLGEVLALSLSGRRIGGLIEGDREIDIRLRLPRPSVRTLDDLRRLPVLPATAGRPRLQLGDVARIELAAAPAEILRDQQQRIVEVTASLSGERPLSEVHRDIQNRLDALPLPEGYRIYDAGAIEALQEGRRMGLVALGLALFLVFVVMAVQYESLRNPLVILLGAPFAAIGAATGLGWLEVPLSMPVWLGLVMLVGIVVNNAIVLVEYIELLRRRGLALREAISEAGRQRLRPILMTTLTTVAGLAPLAAGTGAGSEMLQPLAQTIVFGLSFSMLVSLLLVPVIYLWLHGRRLTRSR